MNQSLLNNIFDLIKHLNSTEAKYNCYKLFLNCTANGTGEFDLRNESCTHFDCQCLPTHKKLCLPKRIQEVHPELPTILLVVFILIAVSSFVANGFMCVVYSLSKEIRTAKHYFLVNLGIADILIAVFGIPFYLTEYIKDDSKTLCQVGSMVDVLCCTCSIISFTVISAERFVAVKYPLRYQTIVSRKRCLVALCFVWGYAITISLASRIPVGEFDMRQCVFFTDGYIIFITFASFLLPLLAMLLTYGWIYKVATYQARQINNSNPSATNRIKREFKAAKTLTLIIGAFVVSWIPLFCYIWVFSLHKVNVPYHDLHYIIQMVRFLNGLANPFIYVGINREFRRSTFKLLKRILPRRERCGNVTNNDVRTQSTELVLRKTSAASTATHCATES
ncbi:alpha-1A adrenergic receptor-like [Paramuricea clavata]|uniref:Alpha-1A adrenergic receptor-like n=1 Tax=Paramuricea clavata TaxID=317549 RepID=A0A7D9IFQ3_PARCT|nr:alpha-1A adrenergic receptor-like [Paramuricea clavata]